MCRFNSSLFPRCGSRYRNKRQPAITVTVKHVGSYLTVLDKEDIEVVFWLENEKRQNWEPLDIFLALYECIGMPPSSPPRELPQRTPLVHAKKTTDTAQREQHDNEYSQYL